MNKSKKEELRNRYKEKIEVSLQKKKECFKEAKKCVESLLEVDISESFLLEKVRFITQNDYQDVVEERAILKICGYALCSNVLQNIPTKQYHISTISNKVYDITERKNFCSNGCYTSSCYLKKQISTNPVWLRDEEDHSKIHLLTDPTSAAPPGQEIPLGIEKVSVVETKCDVLGTVSSYASDVIEELRSMGGACFESLNIHEQIELKKFADAIKQGEVKTENVKQINDSPGVKKDVDSKESAANTKCNLESCQTIEKISSGEPPSLQTHVSPQQSILKPNTKSLDKNVSIKTLEEPPNSYKQKCVTPVASQNIAQKTEPHNNSSSSIGQARMPNFRVDHVEKTAHEWFTVDTINFLAGKEPSESNIEIQKNIELSEEEMKSKAFYSGNFSKQTKTENDPKTTLPSVEKYEQRKVRRKIVLERLSKILPDVIEILGLNMDITREIHGLIETFNLNAHNVMLRPTEWNMMALIMIKALSKLNPELNTSLSSKRSKNRLEKMIQSLQLNTAYLDKFVLDLCNTTEENARNKATPTP